MKIIHLPFVEDPDRYKSSSCDWASLPLVGVTKIIYTYGIGYYEGTGHALLKFGHKGWAYAYLGHCSCYGPLDSVPTTPEAPTLAALTAGWTAAALAERRVVLEAAGWKAVRA